MKKAFLTSLILTIFSPLTILAYSDYIYAGGETIGIELTSDSILIAGTYSINNQNYGNKAGFKVGDRIISIDNVRVKNIAELTKQVQGKTEVSVEYLRNDQTYKTTLTITYDEGIYKTGLYVKDNIMGIGTLTYIDPKTNIYGCLGHEITEKTTREIFEADDGSIFETEVTEIIKSKNGNPGEKIAEFDLKNTFGNVFENTKKGVFGIYTALIKDKKLYKVAEPSEIKTGAAKMLTVIEGDEVKEFDINIIKVNSNDSNRNILFEIVDEELINKTNGIVQGMSGSPIIQGNNIIGAVTHVVVDKPNRGYGIFITSMLKEGENKEK
ncbi:MAG: PDZ domain-containing protein [Bacilli bacterium]|nr:PDZ domain-containing protein [Bacilli bacterium]